MGQLVVDEARAPELAVVVRSWARLPEALRAAVLALVRTAVKPERGGAME